MTKKSNYDSERAESDEDVRCVAILYFQFGAPVLPVRFSNASSAIYPPLHLLYHRSMVTNRENEYWFDSKTREKTKYTKF